MLGGATGHLELTRFTMARTWGKPPPSLYSIFYTFLHQGLNLGEATTFPLIVYFAPLFTIARTWAKPPPSPLQYTLHLSPRPTSKWLFVSRLPNGNPEITKVETPATLWGYNFMCRPLIEMRSKAKLQPSLRSFHQCVACHLHMRKSG